VLLTECFGWPEHVAQKGTALNDLQLYLNGIQ